MCKRGGSDLLYVSSCRHGGVKHAKPLFSCPIRCGCSTTCRGTTALLLYADTRGYTGRRDTERKMEGPRKRVKAVSAQNRECTLFISNVYAAYSIRYMPHLKKH